MTRFGKHARFLACVYILYILDSMVRFTPYSTDPRPTSVTAFTVTLYSE